MSTPEGVIELCDVTQACRDAADVVVIGTGAAGAVAAEVFAEAGLDVVMIEEGPYVPKEDFRRDAWSAFRNLWRDAGFQVAEGRSLMPILQGCAVGGSTLINGAIVHRIPEKIHHVWARDFGADKVFSMSALEQAYDALDQAFSVASCDETVLGGNNKLMRKGAEALGIQSNVIRRNVLGCEGSCACLQGCRNARKRSANFTCVPAALRRGARLYATCRAERLESQGGRVTGVQGRFRDPRTGRCGPTIQVTARRAVIVAASAIQTPLLLADSGIGKRSGRLGQRFQCHPGSAMAGLFDEPVNMWFGATQAYETTHWWDERMKFETVGVPLEIGAGRLPGFGDRFVKNMADFGHIASMGVQIRAQSHGRVRRNLFGRPVIRWDYGAEDIRVLKRGMQRLAEILFAAGARKVWPGIHGIPETIDSPDALAALDDLPDDGRLFHGIASHLFGTAVMGEDPRSAVVDPTLQVHDTEGLFVLDSSVFPTNMGVNPAHTISAVARLAAQRIAETS